MLHIDGIIYSLQRYGGITVCFNELISRLKKNTADFEIGLHNDLMNKDILIEPNILIRNKRLLEARRPAIVDNKSVTVFHSTYYRVPNNRIPFVTTVHDFTYEKYIKGYRACLHSRLKSKAIHSADAIVCVSESTKLDMLNFMPGLDESKVSVIYNGVSNDYYSISNSDIGSDVLFVGSRASYKNFDLAVKAVARVSGLSLVVVGGGDLTPSEVRLLNEKLPSRYMKLGFLSNAELNLLYNSAFCLIHPSSYEGFGISIVESMKSGCPVLCTNVSSIGEVFGDVGYTAKNSDPNEYEQLLRNLFESNYRNETIRKGIEKSMSFSWDRNFSQLTEIYKRL